MLAKQIPAFRLILEPLSREAENLLVRPSYVDPIIGTRHRLGGAPDLPPDAEWPTCRTCDRVMIFYAQLDGLPAPSEFDLADAGLIAVFVCFDCFEVAASFSSA